MSWGGFFYPHRVRIRPLTSSGGMGSAHGPARSVEAEVRDEIRMVRNTDGAEVVSSTQVTVDVAESVPLGSLVTVWPDSAGEREAEVLAVSRNENGADDLDSFLVLSLT